MDSRHLRVIEHANGIGHAAGYLKADAEKAGDQAGADRYAVLQAQAAGMIRDIVEFELADVLGAPGGAS